MRAKLFTALVATALIGASTAASAQSTARPVAPEPSTEALDTGDGSALGSEEALGVVFGLLVIGHPDLEAWQQRRSGRSADRADQPLI